MATKEIKETQKKLTDEQIAYQTFIEAHNKNQKILNETLKSRKKASQEKLNSEPISNNSEIYESIGISSFHKPINWQKSEFIKTDVNSLKEEDLFYLEDVHENFKIPSKPKVEVKTLKNVTIGSDFELFLYDKQIKEVINAKPYVKGSKDFPYNFDPSNKFWCTSLDNVLAEMNIPPCVTAEDFDKNVEKAINYVKSTLPEHITTLAFPAMHVKEEFLNTDESREFGCTPSFNAYTLCENPQPEGTTTNLRTGAFHVHIKYDEMDFELSAELIKVLDLYLGVPSLLIEPPNERRKLYGTAGEFRFSKDKTTEYRVLSNFFSKNSELRSWVFKNTMRGIEKFNTAGPLTPSTSLFVQDTILKNDTTQAKKLIEKYNIPLIKNSIF